MRYPRKSPYLTYRRVGRNTYNVENYLWSEVYQVDAFTVNFLRQLDGKHDPYSILPDCRKEDVRKLVRNLRGCHMFAPEKRLLTIGIGSCIYPLFYCYPCKLQKRLAKIWNMILMLLFVPALVLGIIVHSSGMLQVYWQSKGELYAGMILGVIIGLVLHELSHTCAGLAYNGHLFEIGIGTNYFLPMGYVLLDDTHIKNRFKRIQIDAAGIEINLLLYGVFIYLASLGFINPFVMYLAGIENLVLAILNMLPLDGLDGIKILSIAFQKEDILKHAKGLIRHRRRLKKSISGIGNTFAVVASYVLVGFQAVIPMLLAYEGYSLVKLILL